MRKSQLIKSVLRELPDFNNVDTFFFVKQFEHVLSGFCCEVTPRGAYIWKFVYPLFDRFPCLSLLYSTRLEYPEGYIDFEKYDKKNLANEFLLRIKKHIDDAYHYLSLTQFCGLYEQRPELFKHERAEMAYGYSLILLGERDLAIKHLTNAVASLRGPTLAECLNVLNLVESNIEDAKLKVLNIEHEMKKNIGLKFVEVPT